jgi:hypothetical protein
VRAPMRRRAELVTAIIFTQQDCWTGETDCLFAVVWVNTANSLQTVPCKYMPISLGK